MSYLDDFFDEQSEIIEKFGWAVVHVVPTEDDPPDTVPFAYTVGLTGYGFPELVIAGLPPETGHVLLNEMAGRVCDEGLLLRHGHRIRGLLEGQDVRVVGGEISEVLFPGAALMRYGDGRVRLLQLTWPDPKDRFPWQSGYDSGDYPQPTIGAMLVRTGLRCTTFRGVPGPRSRRTRARGSSGSSFGGSGFGGSGFRDSGGPGDSSSSGGPGGFGGFGDSGDSGDFGGPGGFGGFGDSGDSGDFGGPGGFGGFGDSGDSGDFGGPGGFGGFGDSGDSGDFGGPGGFGGFGDSGDSGDFGGPGGFGGEGGQP
ncbi:DUF4262 domain-containing protein [Actinoplanes italicus]|nr:DUF4262 domain-containing protein [Actinoplanes italicus]